MLITGGTGSFGRALLEVVLAESSPWRRVVVYSRDELKQWELQQFYPEREFPQLRFFLGNVRDRDRLQRALEGIDTVVHAAALKQVPAAEYNPFEFIKTNVLGADNVVQACLDSEVKRVVALSTDKAATATGLITETFGLQDIGVSVGGGGTLTANVDADVASTASTTGSAASPAAAVLHSTHPLMHPPRTAIVPVPAGGTQHTGGGAAH